MLSKKPEYIVKGFVSEEEYLAFQRKCKDVTTGFLLSTQKENSHYEKAKESSIKRTKLQSRCK